MAHRKKRNGLFGLEVLTEITDDKEEFKQPHPFDKSKKHVHTKYTSETRRKKQWEDSDEKSCFVVSTKNKRRETKKR